MIKDGINSREYKKKTYEERICVICKKPFYVRKEKAGPKLRSFLRQRNSITCSRICNKKYYYRNRIKSSEQQSLNNPLN